MTGKSIWCSALCPVYPVEKLYGLNNKISLPNAHCNKCNRCVTPCPDSTADITPLSCNKTRYHKIAGILMVSGFPGFVWGWFQAPSYPGIIGTQELVIIYLYPLLGILISSVFISSIKVLFSRKSINSNFFSYSSFLLLLV